MKRRAFLVARLATLSACTAVLVSCSDTNNKNTDGGGGESACVDGQTRCNVIERQACKGGKWTVVDTCADPTICIESLWKCADCAPGGKICRGADLHSCTDQGTVGALIQTCPGDACQTDHCADPCTSAAESKSYLGCEYWPTVTTNSGLVEDFAFAVVISNQNDKEAEINVSTNANAGVAHAFVPAHSLKVIELPWVGALKNTDSSGGALAVTRSAQVQDGAYYLTSTLPVAAYQFNPLNYMLGHDCTMGEDMVPGDKKCYSYSNDASLLLPQSTLGKEYMVVSWPTTMVMIKGGIGRAPGFFSVVATKTGATQLNIEFSATTNENKGSIPQYTAGQKGTFTLQYRDVLQIVSQEVDDCTPARTVGDKEFCDLSKTTDLTGTVITADKEIAVFAGHDCAFVPFDKFAADHLEEQLFPIATWGTRYFATHTLSAGKDPSIHRVISAKDGNQITFSGGVHDPVTLDRGKHVDLITTQDFEVKGTAKLAVAQYMVGQEYSGSTGSNAPGDPSMSLAVPVEQYRKTYRFLAPESYAQNYLNVIAKPGTTLKLDGKEISGLQAITGTEYAVMKQTITGGAHYIEGSNPFSIVVYGTGSFTSYMYPGGLDLKPFE